VSALTKAGIGKRAIKALLGMFKHRPINRILSELMYDIGFIEKYGSGIYLENELCLKNGNPKPVYEIDTIQTKVIFKSQVRDVTVIEVGEKALEGLHERQKKALGYIKERGRITNKEYQELNSVSNKTAYKDLSELAIKNMLITRGRGKYLYYEIR